MSIRQALQPANDARDQELNYANNIKFKKQTTIDYQRKR